MNHDECTRCGSIELLYIECRTCNIEYCYSCGLPSNRDECPGCGCSNVFDYVI
ncbi:hypothetical protein [Ammoniphilus sp. 3BR4]|uniref:hypothetical protein n=1 Tax=Ammoniphilus sp. 3BR4 TaxID=3158265 RepID=UPI003466D10A